MRILFMGTPEFAVPSLDTLNKSKHEIIGVYTKVDKPNQRGNKVKFSPIKEYALENNIPVYQPNSVKASDVLAEIRELNPDLIVVVAYGKILPQELIDIPKHGIINVHSSILPKYRGAAPIHAAVINGESETGVTIMYIVQELDAGDIIKIGKTPIADSDNLQSVHDRLKIIGATTLLESVNEIEVGKVSSTPQDHSKATFIKPFKKDDIIIDWSSSMRDVFNFTRGMDPFPAATTKTVKKAFKIYRVEEYKKNYQGKCGEVVDLYHGKGPVVKVGDGAVIILDAKPENKKRLQGSDLINGKHLEVGDTFYSKEDISSAK